MDTPRSEYTTPFQTVIILEPSGSCFPTVTAQHSSRNLPSRNTEPIKIQFDNQYLFLGWRTELGWAVIDLNLSGCSRRHSIAQNPLLGPTCWPNTTRAVTTLREISARPMMHTPPLKHQLTSFDCMTHLIDPNTFIPLLSVNHAAAVAGSYGAFQVGFHATGATYPYGATGLSPTWNAFTLFGVRSAPAPSGLPSWSWDPATRAKTTCPLFTTPPLGYPTDSGAKDALEEERRREASREVVRGMRRVAWGFGDSGSCRWTVDAFRWAAGDGDGGALITFGLRRKEGWSDRTVAMKRYWIESK
ncbi:hypothetical protein BKA70DRAFT_1236320 [Coprinopsis sp. MPI-PUGE-AT-0042]|nr:hypothetical protein BKA70DRAFT_1236320 [Coprinopsis sp. MPI-PUGE-AT-0042]